MSSDRPSSIVLSSIYISRYIYLFYIVPDDDGREYIPIFFYQTIRVCTHHRLSVTILATHGKIQSKGVAIDDIHVAGFRSSQSIDSPTEGFVGVDVDDDSGVFTMNRD